MEITSATALTSPTKTKTNAMALVSIVAFLGSFFPLVPFDTHLLINLLGKTLSIPIACKVLGATINESKADDMVAAARPIRMIGTQRAILLIIN